jgi:hypothetical protein
MARPVSLIVTSRPSFADVRWSQLDPAAVGYDLTQGRLLLLLWLVIGAGPFLLADRHRPAHRY